MGLFPHLERKQLVERHLTGLQGGQGRLDSGERCGGGGAAAAAAGVT